MPKPDLKATVASLAEVAQKTGGVFVFATRDANLPRGEDVSAVIAEYPFAEHTCNDCTAVFSAVKAEGLQNHCIACGSEKTVAATISKPTIPSDNELSYLSCSACGTHNVFAAALGREVASKLCCTTCGNHLHFTATAEADEGDSDDMLDVDDMEMLDLDGDGIPDEEDELVAKKTTADTTMDDLGNKAAELPEAGPSSGKPPETTAVDTPPTDAKGPSEPGPTDGPQVPAALASFDLLDTVSSTETLSFAYLGKKVAMLAGVKIVATLDPADAGDNADILQTQAFIEAVAHTANTQGVKAAVAHYKFKAVTVEVPVKAMIDKAVEAKLAGDKAQVTAALDAVQAQFQHATDIAAAGQAGNFWRNKPDGLKSALIAELSSLGIASAQRVVDRVFAAHGVAQLRDVLALARELADKPPEALNALAQAIDLVKYQPTPVKAEADEEDEDDEDNAEDEDDKEEATVRTMATAVDEPDAVFASTNQFRFKDKTLAALLQDGKSLF